MRDYALIVLVFGSLPFIVWRPYIGILMWSWLGYMNPHRYTWMASSMPFAQVVAAATLAGLVVSREPKRLPWSAALWVWLGFIFWMSVTTVFALRPAVASAEWQDVIKIQVMALVTLVLIRNKFALQALVWVTALSLGFYGVKGGAFTILTGGQYRVWGPPRSFIEDNNDMALALLMTLPLLMYLAMQMKNRWLRLALQVSAGLTAAAVLGSQSRGALLGFIGLCGVLWWRSRRKVAIGVGIAVVLILVLSFMPAAWWERMQSIKDYEEDASAMGRINAWTFAVNLANARPLVGGGFDCFERKLFFLYAPDPDDFHDAHSVYFEVLGEHGYVGIALFLTLGVLTLRMAGRIIRRTSNAPDRKWAHDLAAMTQVSLVAFAICGAFLGRAYFDLYYGLIGVVLITDSIVRAEEVAELEASREKQAGQQQTGGTRPEAMATHANS